YDPGGFVGFQGELDVAGTIQVFAEIEPTVELSQVFEIVMPCTFLSESTWAVMQPEGRQSRIRLDRHALGFGIDSRIEIRVGSRKAVVIAKGEQRRDPEPARSRRAVQHHHRLLAIDHEQPLLDFEMTNPIVPRWKRIQTEADEMAITVGVNDSGILV